MARRVGALGPLITSTPKALCFGSPRFPEAYNVPVGPSQSKAMDCRRLSRSNQLTPRLSNPSCSICWRNCGKARRIAGWPSRGSGRLLDRGQAQPLGDLLAGPEAAHAQGVLVQAGHGRHLGRGELLDLAEPVDLPVALVERGHG